MTGKFLRLGLNKPPAQGTRLVYVVTGFLNKETSCGSKIKHISVEGVEGLSGTNRACEPTTDECSVDDNQFD